MSALHTPGPLIACEAPWDDSEYKTEVMVPGRAGQFGTSVATCHHNWREAGAGERKISWAEAQANALLYAAAPDLLKALEAIVTKIDPVILVESDHPMSPFAEELRVALAAIARAKGGA